VDPKTSPPEDLNPFHIATQQFDRAAGLLPSLPRDLVGRRRTACRQGNRGCLAPADDPPARALRRFSG
jgi:hypothetical protein